MFLAVGLTGDDETGRGDSRAWLVETMGTARASFGLVALASMVMVWSKWYDYDTEGEVGIATLRAASLGEDGNKNKKWICQR